MGSWVAGHATSVSNSKWRPAFGRFRLERGTRSDLHVATATGAGGGVVRGAPGRWSLDAGGPGARRPPTEIRPESGPRVHNNRRPHSFCSTLFKRSRALKSLDLFSLQNVLVTCAPIRSLSQNAHGHARPELHLRLDERHLRRPLIVTGERAEQRLEQPRSQ
eukprot:3496418-Prymnesium_polylepis.1